MKIFKREILPFILTGILGGVSAGISAFGNENWKYFGLGTVVGIAFSYGYYCGGKSD